jgi:hypothetical protein
MIVLDEGPSAGRSVVIAGKKDVSNGDEIRVLEN